MKSQPAQRPARSSLQSKPRRTLYLAVLAASQMMAGHSLASPQGGQVVGGAGSIAQSGSNTTIEQHSDRLAIDWQSFDVAADERVEFLQPTSSSIALNRVLSHRGSEIHGRIDANGHVFLVNPNGVIFGAGSRINVGGLIASGLDIEPAAFMNGDFKFSALDGAQGAVVNGGIITAATGGSVGLIGRQVRNDGLISAKLGAVTLAAGKEAVLTFEADGLVGIRVSEAVLQDELGIDAAVINNGDIVAAGGRIILSASASQDIFSQAVNHGETGPARSVLVHEDGSFTLGSGANVHNAGNIDVSADEGAGQAVLIGENVDSSGVVRADSRLGPAGVVELHSSHTTRLLGDAVVSARADLGDSGGQITVLGHHVGLFDRARLDASGALGGGEILFGGGFQGNNQLMRNAGRSYVGADAVLQADALMEGDGGRVIVWADEITRFGGTISGRGAGQGRGGFAEVSGKEFLSFNGFADLSGSTKGTLLLDPRDIVIQLEGEDIPDESLAFDDRGDDIVTIKADSIEQLLNTTSVQLQATNDIVIFQEIITGSDNTSSLSFTAGNAIRVSESVDIGAGNLSFTSGHFSCGLAECAAGTSAAGRSFLLDEDRSLSTTGTLKIFAADDVIISGTIGANLDPQSVAIRAGNDITISDTGSINAGAGNGNYAVQLLAGDSTLASDGLTVAPSIIGDASPGGVRIASEINTAGGNVLIGSATVSAGSIDSTAGVIDSGTEESAGDILMYADGNVDLGELRARFTGSPDEGTGDKGGNLTISTNGNISQADDTNLRIAGSSTFDAGSGGISLTEDGNDFGGTISVLSASGLELHDENDVELGTVDLTAGGTAGYLSITAGGNISDLRGAIPDGEDPASFGIISVPGLVTLNTIGSIRLDGYAHKMHTISELSGIHELAIRNHENLTLNAITIDKQGGGVSVATDGALTLLGAVTTSGGIGTHGGDISLIAGQVLTVGGALSADGGRSSDHSRHGEDAGAITLGGSEITLSGNLRARGSKGQDDEDPDGAAGAINITGKVLLSNNLQFNPDGTHRSGRLANVIITGDVNSTGDIARSLGINAATINIDGDVGRTHALSELTVTGANSFSSGDIRVLSDLTLKVDNGSIRTGTINTAGLIDQKGGDVTLWGREIVTASIIANAGAQSPPPVEDPVPPVEDPVPPPLPLKAGVISIEATADDSGAASVTINGDVQAANSDSVQSTANVTLIGSNADEANSFTFGGTSLPSANINVSGSDGDDVIHVANVATKWTITDDGVGSIGSAAGDIRFWNMETLVASGGPGDILAANTGTDNTWIIDSVSGNSFNDNTRFSGFEDLLGGSGEDTFVFRNEGSIAGDIDGGSNSGNVIDYSQLTNPVEIILGPEFEGVSRIQTLRGNVGSTLGVVEGSNNWTINDENSGYINGDAATASGFVGNVYFEGFANLNGGSGSDIFAIIGNGSITGTIDAGLGDDHVDMATATRTYQVELGEELDVDLNLLGVEQVSGDNSGGSQLIVASGDNNWLITGANSGQVGDVKFSGFGHLRGGTGEDHFTLSGTAAEVSGSIDGGGGTASNSLTGRDIDSTWSLSAAQQGQLAVAVSGTVYVEEFSRIQSLVGGSATDTLIGRDQNNSWVVDGFGSGSVAEALASPSDTIFFQNMENLTGNDAADVFRFDGGSIAGNLAGGAGEDTFHITSASIQGGTVDGGDGNDEINLQVLSGDAGSLSIAGDAGADQLNITGGGSGYRAFHESATAAGGTLRYGKAADEFSITYTSMAAIDDQLTADTLLVSGTTANDTFTFTDNRYALNGFTDIGFGNKNNITVAAQTNDTIAMQGHIQLPGSLVLENAAITANADGLIEAASLQLRNTDEVGSAAQRLRTQVDDLMIEGAWGPVFIQEANGLNLAAFSTNSAVDLEIVAGNLGSSADLISSHALTANAQNGDVLLEKQNQLSGPLSLFASGAINLHNNTTTDLAEVGSTSLSIDSSGAINGSGPVVVSGDSKLRAEGDISLSHSNNDFNRLQASGENITIFDRTDLILSDTAARAALAANSGQQMTIEGTVTAGNGIVLESLSGNLVQSGTLDAGDEGIQFTAGADISMGANAASVTTGSISFTSRNMTVASLEAQTIHLAATGGISDGNDGALNASADRLELRAENGIGSGDGLETSVRFLSLTNNNGASSINNDRELTVTGLRSNGDVTLMNSAGNLYLDNSDGTLYSRSETDARLAGGTVDANYNLGTLMIDVANGSLLATAPDDLHDPIIAARNVSLVTRRGSIGESDRPLVLHVQDSLVLVSALPSWTRFAFETVPRNVDDSQSLSGDLIDLLTSGGDQLVVIEGLEDVDPAVFTNVRNYSYDDVAIRLPDDQSYEDDQER